MNNDIQQNLATINVDMEVIEDKVINDTLNELEYSSILEFIAKKCLTQKGYELISTALPINYRKTTYYFDNLNINLDDNKLINENVGQLWLNKELTQIDEMVRLLTSGEQLPIENVGDIRDILQKTKIEGSVLNTDEIVKILDIIRVSRNLKQFFQRKTEKYFELSKEILPIYDSQVLQNKIGETIDNTGNIKDNATKELYNIRIEITEKSNRLRAKMNKIVRQFSDNEWVQEEFYTVRDGRFVLPVKSEHKRHLTGIIHGVSQTGSTVYIEPTEIVEMNNDISLLKSEEQREIYNILKRLTSLISKDSISLNEAYSIIGHIDSIHAKSAYSLQFGGIKPEIFDLDKNHSNEIYLNKIYHPILVQNKGKQNVVPLSIVFNTDKKGHLISGPNAGGKTVALKSIGLNILLATSGFFPIGEVKTPIISVFSAIGDNQSITNDLSTFSSQLLKMKRILDVVDFKSLVLIDEICSGTDPREGGALAAGIIDTFIELNLFFVVTTHQSALKTYALNYRKPVDNNQQSDTPRFSTKIENDSFEFDEVALKPTYKFLSGIPGNSYAFFLAKNVGLSGRVLSRAKKYLGGRQKQLEKSISVLQKFKKETESVINEAKTEKLKYENMKKDYENRNKEFTNKKKKLIDDAKIEANEILLKANSLIENTVKELREEKKNIAETKADFNKKQNEIALEVTKIKQQRTNKNALDKLSDIEIANELAPDDSVGMLDNAGTGTVIEADNITKTALVAFNGFKFRLPYDQLYLKEKSKIRKSSIAKHITLELNTKLDLRGQRAEDAINETINFIAQAVMSSAHNVTIVHGKGTGALRQAIHELLRNTSNVKSFRLGEIYEGGSGVTIAYFN